METFDHKSSPAEDPLLLISGSGQHPQREASGSRLTSGRANATRGRRLNARRSQPIVQVTSSLILPSPSQQLVLGIPGGSLSAASLQSRASSASRSSKVIVCLMQGRFLMFLITFTPFLGVCDEQMKRFRLLRTGVLILC